MELTDLDDEFEVSLDENKKFKGLPRPELDQAWVDILKGRITLVSQLIELYSHS